MYISIAHWTEKVLTFLGDIIEFPLKQVNHSGPIVHVMRILLGENNRQQARTTENEKEHREVRYEN